MVRSFPLSKKKDLQKTRRAIMALSTELGLGRLEITKLLTIGAEIGQYIIDKNSSAIISLEKVSYLGRVGIKLSCEEPNAFSGKDQEIQPEKFPIAQSVKQIADQFEFKTIENNTIVFGVTIWQE